MVGQKISQKAEVSTSSPYARVSLLEPPSRVMPAALLGIADRCLSTLSSLFSGSSVSEVVSCGAPSGTKAKGDREVTTTQNVDA